MRAIMVDGRQQLVVAEAPPPVPSRGEAVVRVTAISLNRGEVRRSQSAKAGFRPGWDLAGVVEQAAADGSGPVVGTRVVGILIAGAWAELVAVPTDALAAVPDTVSDAQAACLPVAGLTALHALMQRGDLLGRSVLVTGATGGVGHFGCRLAKLAGARVVGVARSAASEAAVRRFGADQVAVIGDDPSRSIAYGPFDLVLESVGGASMSASIAMLAADGICVVFGSSAAAEASFDARAFFLGGGRRIFGLALFHELATREPARIGLSRLLQLVAAGQLSPEIAVDRPWGDVAAVADDLINRRYPGKAVLRLAAA